MPFKFRIRHALRSTLYAGGTMRGASPQLRGSLTPHATRPECSCVKLTPVLARVTARLTAANSAAREVLATRLPTSSAGKRLPKWHTHMVRIAGPRLKRRAPGFRRDRRGLSHSDNSHTTIYRLTLPSVEHAGCAAQPTLLSSTGLATGYIAVIRAMIRARTQAISTQQRFGGPISRAARRVYGRWIARERHSTLY